MISSLCPLYYAMFFFLLRLKDVLGFDPELLQMVPPNALAVLFLFPVDDHVCNSFPLYSN